ncbi:hypothetical protein FOA52_000811 [Chlamydomonas sp. UWO 241]|nr:hypothetical protein FOA52_000811 [Chlamydomonas sp. UWO 241]
MSLQYSEALARLQNCKSKEGGSVFDSLTKVLAKALEGKPEGAVDLLETSLLSKQADAAPAPGLVPIQSAADAARGVATAGLFGNQVTTDPETGVTVEPEAPADFESDDVVADGYLFHALGVGLGRAEMYSAMLAAKKLAGDGARGVSTVRFFGKFFGTQACYYVYECTVSEPPEVPEAPEGEVPNEAGTGTNNYVYYVCNYLGGPFTMLPVVLPAHIKAARSIRKFLTGKLDSPVSTYPVFPGTEALFLRCQITRIACSTVCCPVGSMTVEEDSVVVEKNLEWEGVRDREGGVPAVWAHRYPHLKAQGRCELDKREAPDGEEDTFVWTADELEVGPASLATLEVDAMLANGAPSWSGLSSSINSGVRHQVGGVRSNLWPGAYCAAKGKHFTNLYVGWGLKHAPYAPPPPPPLAPCFDVASLVEQNELPPPPPPPEAAEADERMDEEEATAAAAERIAAAAEDGTGLPVRLATDVVRFLYGGTGRREPADGGVVSASLLNAKPAVGGIGVEPRGGGVLRVLFTVAFDAVADTVVRWRRELRRCVDSTAVLDVLSDREEAQHQALWPAFLAAKVAGKRAQFHRARLVVDGERVPAPAC